MTSRIRFAALAAVLALGTALGGAGAAQAQYCEGTVHGLSGVYNLARGTGFLAVRARPSSSSRMVGQFFNNGDTTEIVDRRGNWYHVVIGGIDGWASARYIWNSCGY